MHSYPEHLEATSAGTLASAIPGAPAAVGNSRSSNAAPIPRKRRRIDSSAAGRGSGAAAPSEVSSNAQREEK